MYDVLKTAAPAWIQVTAPKNNDVQRLCESRKSQKTQRNEKAEVIRGLPALEQMICLARKVL
jgi:hypothetical protein